jgi:putative transposase
MAIKLKHSDTFSTYFVTFTCVEWISLFEIANGYDMVYKWFDILKREHNADVIAYVIMPNHLHVILHFHDAKFDLNTIIANGKRFIAYEIINRLENAGNSSLLCRLAALVTEREKRKGQVHKVFKSSFDAKAIITHSFLMQKINYIHNNPVSGKWMLAKDFVEYEHSSASFYEIQLVRHHRPLHYLDL